MLAVSSLANLTYGFAVRTERSILLSITASRRKAIINTFFLTVLTSASLDLELYHWKWEYTNAKCKGKTLGARSILGADFPLARTRLAPAELKNSISWKNLTTFYLIHLLHH